MWAWARYIPADSWLIRGPHRLPMQTAVPRQFGLLAFPPARARQRHEISKAPQLLRGVQPHYLRRKPAMRGYGLAKQKTGIPIVTAWPRSQALTSHRLRGRRYLVHRSHFYWSRTLPGRACVLRNWCSGSHLDRAAVLHWNDDHGKRRSRVVGQLGERAPELVIAKHGIVVIRSEDHHVRMPMTNTSTQVLIR